MMFNTFAGDGHPLCVTSLSSLSTTGETNVTRHTKRPRLDTARVKLFLEQVVKFTSLQGREGCSRGSSVEKEEDSRTSKVSTVR